MEINKLEQNIFELLASTMKSYISAWYKIPTDINLERLNIERVRYMKEWGLKDALEDAFIVEISTETDRYRVILARSELGLTTEHFKKIFKEQSENGLLFIKDIIVHQEWYEYPVIWGNLDKVFDDIDLYEKNGKYEKDNYIDFKKKYDN